jgi:CheY-like chemotaxis protein
METMHVASCCASGAAAPPSPFAEGRATEHVRRRLRILLVEDDAEMRRLVASRLRVNGHELTECEDGWAFLRRIESAGEPEGFLDFDLIVCDIRLPGLTGLEVLELLRTKDRRTPVIATTAFGDLEVRIRAARLGVIAFFDKPFDVGRLCRTAESVASSLG